ncbi:hypothetical protein K501DRAFT_310450 [Backusella circina FSU 941]|nr:hypothetical protein K501DRAFT_310450 [Backusella circina FSU 941]
MKFAIKSKANTIKVKKEKTKLTWAWPYHSKRFNTALSLNISTCVFIILPFLFTFKSLFFLMTESRIKSLWKRQSGQSKMISSSSSSTSSIRTPSMTHSSRSSISSNSVNRHEQQLWRKPLPPDCPKFEFAGDTGSTNGEKTLIQLDAQVNSAIPIRRDSRFYKQIPYFDALLERTCKSKRVVMVSEMLRNK